MLKQRLVKRNFAQKACRHFINGLWVDGADPSPLKILNPVDGL